MNNYTEDHALAGIDSLLPDIETWPNQYPDYVDVVRVPEFTSICPKTGLPDFATITIEYVPDQSCLELKSFKVYIHAYRDLGMFVENVVNRILRDVVTACRPKRCKVIGEFRARGGISSTIIAQTQE